MPPFGRARLGCMTKRTLYFVVVVYVVFFFLCVCVLLHLAVVACSEPKRRLWCATPCPFLVNVLYTLQMATSISKATVLRRKFMPCTMGALATLSANFSAASTSQVLKLIKNKNKNKKTCNTLKAFKHTTSTHCATLKP